MFMHRWRTAVATIAAPSSIPSIILTILTIPAILTFLTMAAPVTAAEIHRAVESGDLARVQELLAVDPGLVSVPDDDDQFDSLPLHLAARHGHFEITEALLDAGAEVDAVDSDRSTPLDVAALNNQLVVVDLLIARGADINHADNNGATPLSFAATRGNLEVVTRLVAAGADLMASNARNGTYLHLAVTGGNMEFASLVLDAGVPVDAADEAGTTPLLYATWFGKPDLVELLVERGADVNLADAAGNTPLVRAAQSGETKSVEILLGAGAEVAVVDPRNGRTALHIAAVKGYGDMAQLLVASGADPGGKDSKGCTPLDLAVHHGNDQAAEYLGADTAAAAAESDQHHCPGDLAAQTCPAQGEAVVWYLGHSAWAVKTHSNFLVFDYWERGRQPDDRGLSNGCICGQEIADEKVTVFVSHGHGDHYDPLIFDWREKVADVTYVMGFAPEDATDNVTDYELIEGRDQRRIGDIEVATITSNDSGVGFMVTVDGVTIFHAGDHANRQQDFSGPYAAEIDYLAEAGYRPDIALMPISGCGFGDQEAVRLGVMYALDKLQPKVFLPMHAGGSEYRCAEFKDQCDKELPALTTAAVSDRGDHYRYSQGKVF